MDVKMTLGAQERTCQYDASPDNRFFNSFGEFAVAETASAANDELLLAFIFLQIIRL
jgi:hypothetical protein